MYVRSGLKLKQEGRILMVRCICGAENPEYAKFCQECGNNLAIQSFPKETRYKEYDVKCSLTPPGLEVQSMPCKISFDDEGIIYRMDNSKPSKIPWNKIASIDKLGGRELRIIMDNGYALKIIHELFKGDGNREIYSIVVKKMPMNNSKSEAWLKYGLYSKIKLPDYEIREASRSSRATATLTLGIIGYALTAGTVKERRKIETIFREAKNGVVISKGTIEGKDLRIPWENILNVNYIRNRKFDLNLTDGSLISIEIHPHRVIKETKEIVNILQSKCNGQPLTEEGW